MSGAHASGIDVNGDGEVNDKRQAVLLINRQS
jgi:hypothetical protein